MKEYILNHCTDLIVSIMLLTAFYRGWSRGLFKTLLGPLCFIAATILSYYFYKQGGNFFLSLLIGLLGPFILYIIISSIFKKSQKPDEKKDEPSVISRILASFLSISWSGGFIILTILCLMIIPNNLSWIATAQENIRSSQTYQTIDGFKRTFLPESLSSSEGVSSLLSLPDMSSIQDTKEFKEIISDTKLQNLFADEKILQDITDKNIAALMSNPKVQSVMNDPGLREKIDQLNRKILLKN